MADTPEGTRVLERAIELGLRGGEDAVGELLAASTKPQQAVQNARAQCLRQLQGQSAKSPDLLAALDLLDETLDAIE